MTARLPDVVVYLVRHGRTALNTAGRLRGHLDVSLDDVGRGEADALGRLFRGLPVTAVVSSPLARARATAAPIVRSTGAPLHVDIALADRDYGAWAGMGQVEVEARFGTLDAAPGVESVEAVADRAAACLDRLAVQFPSGPVVAVAHDAVNRLVPSLGPPDRIR